MKQQALDSLNEIIEIYSRVREEISKLDDNDIDIEERLIVKVLLMNKELEEKIPHIS